MKNERFPPLPRDSLIPPHVLQIGFLSEKRRMNVAITRAKRLCVIVGDRFRMRYIPWVYH